MERSDLETKVWCRFSVFFHKRNRIRNKKSREHAKENGKDVLRSNPNHRSKRRFVIAKKWNENYFFACQEFLGESAPPPFNFNYDATCLISFFFVYLQSSYSTRYKEDDILEGYPEPDLSSSFWIPLDNEDLSKVANHVLKVKKTT